MRDFTDSLESLGDIQGKYPPSTLVLRAQYVYMLQDQFRDLEESHKKEVGQLLMEIVELKERLSKERSEKVDYKISANDLSYGLAKAYEDNRKLKRALYKACANWAWAELVRYVDISDGSQGYKQAQGRWEKMASKCLKKAEEAK